MNRFPKRHTISIVALALTTGAGVYYLSRRQAHQTSTPGSHSRQSSPQQQTEMTITTPFQTVFAVPMTCDSCVKDVSDTLHKLQGISKVEADLKAQLVSIEGTAPPSAIVDAIQATGRDAILRGSGTSNSAAVSILETFHAQDGQEAGAQADEDFPLTHGDFGPAKRHVRGLARFVQVNEGTTLVDVTLRGIRPGAYRASIREYGNLADGAASTGPVWSGPPGRGLLGTVQIGPDGRGSAFLDSPFKVWEVVGHAMVVTKQDEVAGRALENDEDTVVGVIARSAGVWDNDKTVCSCTGKTLWEERKDEVGKGML